MACISVPLMRRVMLWETPTRKSDSLFIVSISLLKTGFKQNTKHFFFFLMLLRSLTHSSSSQTGWLCCSSSLGLYCWSSWSGSAAVSAVLRTAAVTSDVPAVLAPAAALKKVFIDHSAILVVVSFYKWHLMTKLHHKIIIMIWNLSVFLFWQWKIN